MPPKRAKVKPRSRRVNQRGGQDSVEQKPYSHEDESKDYFEWSRGDNNPDYGFVRPYRPPPRRWHETGAIGFIRDNDIPRQVLDVYGKPALIAGAALGTAALVKRKKWASKLVGKVNKKAGNWVDQKGWGKKHKVVSF